MESSPEADIRARIASEGRITFAEFMNVALYHTAGGYYSRGSSTSDHRDYYTSPAAHPAFGALIAIQLRRMWEVLERPSPFYAVEMGAGNGLLARDVVGYALTLPSPFTDALRYIALDRSSVHGEPDGRAAGYQRVVAQALPIKGVVGCFFSNELVDSFPVHRFQIQRGAIKELYLSLRDERFVEVLGEISTPLLERHLDHLRFRLPEGYRGEINLQIGPWMAEIARALKRGFVLTMDYGYEAGDLYSPERAYGTLQTYYRHASGASPYELIGMQDITAHVDFSSLISGGNAIGLRPIGLCTQAHLLRGLGLEEWVRRLRTKHLTQRNRDANMMAMRELVRPDGLGAFKVLVQEKGTEITRLGELSPSKAPPSESGGWADDLPVPLLRPQHVPLMEGRYPHLTWDFEELTTSNAGPKGTP